jgi:hypothetical protein
MITGSVDDLGRPYVRVDAPGGYSVLLQIDTGVNRKLVINRNAIYLLEPNNSTVYERSFSEVELADFSKTQTLRGAVELIWFGKVEVIETLITVQVPRHPPHPDQPVGLIGTELLKDCRLIIDFPQRLVEIYRN